MSHPASTYNLQDFLAFIRSMPPSFIRDDVFESCRRFIQDSSLSATQFVDDNVSSRSESALSLALKEGEFICVEAIISLEEISEEQLREVLNDISETPTQFQMRLNSLLFVAANARLSVGTIFNGDVFLLERNMQSLINLGARADFVITDEGDNALRNLLTCNCDDLVLLFLEKNSESLPDIIEAACMGVEDKQGQKDKLLQVVTIGSEYVNRTLIGGLIDAGANVHCSGNAIFNYYRNDGRENLREFLAFLDEKGLENEKGRYLPLDLLEFDGNSIDVFPVGEIVEQPYGHRLVPMRNRSISVD